MPITKHSSAPRPNSSLRSQREGIPLTQAELAKQVGVAEITVRRWEAGLRPQPAHIRRLCAVLHASPTDLGYGAGDPGPVEPVTDSFVEGPPSCSVVGAPTLLGGQLVEGDTPALGASDVATMAGDTPTSAAVRNGRDAPGSGPERGEATERRDFLKLTFAAGVAPLTLSRALAQAAEEAVGFTRGSGTSEVGRGTFDQLEGVLVDLERSYGWASAADLFPVARIWRAQVDGMIQGRHTLKEGQELYVYAAWFSWHASSLSYDLGATTTAQAYAIDCWHHAEQADHSELCGWAMDAVASIALRGGRPEDSLAAARRGMAKVPAQHPLAVRLRTKAARAHARLSDRRRCEELLGEAGELHERLPARAAMRFDADAAPLTLWAMTSLSASASIHLEDFAMAHQRAEQSLAAWASLPSEHRSPSREAQSRIDLAQAAAGLGSPDQAVEQGRLAITSPTVIASVLSGAGVLDHMLMARYPSLPEVRDFHDQYRQAVRQATTV